MAYAPLTRPFHSTFSRASFATRDAPNSEGNTNKQDHQAPRDNENIQNPLMTDPGGDKHLGSTKTLVSTLDPGVYQLETITGGQVLLYRYDSRTNALLDQGKAGTGSNTGDFTKLTGDSERFIAGVNAANRKAWPRPDPVKRPTASAMYGGGTVLPPK